MTGADEVLEVDCSSGTASMRALTPEEAAARSERTAAPDALLEQTALRAAALEQVRVYAADDPAYAALATALGLL